MKCQREKRWIYKVLVAVLLFMVVQFCTAFLSEKTVYTVQAEVDENGFDIRDGVLVEYTGNASEVVIPEGVTEIWDSAFMNCTGLTSIIIPEGVNKIGNNAFYECTKLTNITIPESMISIGDNAFYNCIGLTNIDIPQNVTSIGDYAFWCCSNLTEIIIPEGVTSIKGSFCECASLKNITIPKSLKVIGDYSFSDCISLESVKMLEGVTSIGKFAFMNCTSLTVVVIPRSVTIIKAYAFLACTSLEEILIPESVTAIEEATFAYCTSLASIEIPESVASIAWAAFESCSSLNNIIIPESVTSIGENAFFGMPDSVLIYVAKDSFAEEYIKEQGYGYKYIDDIELIPSDPITDFVTRMYRIILVREPDAGSSTWINGLKDGSMTGVRVADGFVLSEEMLNKDISNEDFVKILYRAFFGREADEGGLATWKGILDAGCKKQYIFAGFANSGEFGKLCADAGIVQGRAAEYWADKQAGLSEKDYKLWCFVERMYMAVLERTADLDGVMNWVGLLQAGTKTGIELADGFLMSEEFLAKEMTDEEYVQTLYRAFFNRDADPEGLATWTGVLANGWTKQRVFAGFANSNEFGVLCEQAGIVRGTAEEQ